MNHEELDRRWRAWAGAAVGGSLLFSLVLGFVVLPAATAEPGFDPLAAICRSIGIPGFERPEGARQLAAAGVAPTAAPPTSGVSWTPESRNLLANADVQQGATTAAELCVACHGKDGVAVVPIYPHLAHQSAAAIYKQLSDYKSGARAGGLAAVMVPMATSLNDQQMANVAAYYASRAPRVTESSTNAAPEIVRLVKIGSPARALPPCDSCHGVNMSGPEESPVLLGQSAAYFEQQLSAFAAGERRNDTYGRMRIIARGLTPDEITQLAAYYDAASP
jgi:cytochrome c553